MFTWVANIHAVVSDAGTAPRRRCFALGAFGVRDKGLVVGLRGSGVCGALLRYTARAELPLEWRCRVL